MCFVFLLALSFPGYQPAGLVNDIATEQRIVFITFDDGPKTGVTEPLLNILASENVKASFFLVGDSAVKYPDLIEMIHKQGHDVGNHTFDHIRLDNLSGDDLDYQLQETNRVIEDVLGNSPRFFRPPGGRFNNVVLEALRKYGLIPIGWAINTSDYLEWGGRKLTPAQLQAKVNKVLAVVRANLHPGAIVLMHNGNDISITALPLVIKYVRSQGYQFKKLSDVL
jgi:peptidoglycan/xylan/chitin deacetylase (PgdA/CDA1 family)